MKQESYYIQQIDLLKCLAIIIVILGHTFSFERESLIIAEGTTEATAVTVTASQYFQNLDIVKIFTHWITYSSLITQQVIPVLVALMAFNYAFSYRRKSYTEISDLYSKSELFIRLRRFLMPLVFLYLITFLIAAVYYLLTHTNILSFSIYSIGGYLPIRGPGNYFIPIVFQFLFVFPIIFWTAPLYVDR